MNTSELLHKLRTQLNLYDKDYREKQNSVSKLDEKIQAKKAELNNLPLRVNHLSQQKEKNKSQIDHINGEILKKQADIQSLIERETVGLNARKLRTVILEKVCDSNESGVIVDGVDIKTAEIRRQIGLLNEQKAELINKKDSMIKQMEEQELQISEESQKTLKINLEHELYSLNDERNVLETSR